MSPSTIRSPPAARAWSTTGFPVAAMCGRKNWVSQAVAGAPFRNPSTGP
jgi:hypothetical protein